MRDRVLYATFRELEQRVGSDIGTVLQAIGVIETRQRALEKLLFSGRFRLLTLGIVQALSPKTLEKWMSVSHSQLLKAYTEKMAAAVKEKNEGIKRVTGGIVAPVAVLLALCLSGCVTRQRYHNLHIEYVKVVDERDVAKRMATYCADQQVKMVEILRKFNQVNAAGEIRPKKK